MSLLFINTGEETRNAMFYGSIPSEAQSIIYSIVKQWGVQDIYVGASGNFAVERLISPMEKFRLHGNDTSLYSLCLGRYFEGNPVPLQLREESQEQYAWVLPYMETDIDKIATVMLFTKILPYAGKTEPYYVMMFEEYVKQYPQLHKKTVEKLENGGVKLASYTSGDAMVYAQEAPKDAGYVTFPSVKSAGGYSGYGKDYKKLQVVFEYEEPDYQPLNNDNLVDYFREITEKRAWCFGTDICLEEEPFKQHLKGKTKTTNRGTTLYIYANSGKTQVVVPRQNLSPVPAVRLGEGMEVGSDIKLNILSADAFSALRSQYLNSNIATSSATMAVGVTVDGYLIGVYAVSTSSPLASWSTYIETPEMYLMSDFAVEPVDYKHLSKLVLYAALSKESQRLMERVVKKRVVSLVTTAFSKNPMSMKYRGLFEVLSRKEASGEDTAHRYEINYGAIMGQWTLAEGIATWKKKYAQKRKEGEKAIND